MQQIVKISPFFNPSKMHFASAACKTLITLNVLSAAGEE